MAAYDDHMCFFITVALECLPGEPIDRFTRARPPLALAPVSNEALERRLQPREQWFRATCAYCDCDTHLGAAKRVQASQDREARKIEREAAQHRKAGWSEQKVRRWLEAKREAKVPPNQRPHELESFASFLREVARSRKNGAALLLHMYDGALDAPFSVEEESVPVAEVNERWLAGVQEDVVYRIG